MVVTSAPYEILPYSVGAFVRILVEKSSATRHIIERKLHHEYFASYFARLGVQTIVVENTYIDRDFLEDYADYYVRCFRDYPRQCARLHFFSHTFDDRGFLGVLTGREPALQELLERSYCGFIVVKPLPQTMLGRTCLRKYPEGDNRRYPITRPYEAHLFGLTLTVDTLAFQEQDAGAAACATSALWSVFQGTGVLFQHPIPSPVAITRAATAASTIETPALPSHGLTFQQLAVAIRSIGLEPYGVNVANDDYVLKSTLYAYLRGGVPILMAIKLAAIDDDAEDDQRALYDIDRRHAIAVTGFNIPDQAAGPSTQSIGPEGFLSVAARMDRIYAHDDQVGPFARMLLDGITVRARGVGSEPQDHASLSTSWRDKQGRPMRAVLDKVLIPLYHKLRIPFERIHDTFILPFDATVEGRRQDALESGALMPLSRRLEWDIYLSDVNRLKADMRASDALPAQYRSEILLETLPRFLWRALACCAGEPIAELIFDPTDIEQGSVFIRAIEYDALFSEMIRVIARQFDQQDTLETRPDRAIWRWFARETP